MEDTMEKKKISTEQRLEYNAAVTCLENLLAAFKTGSIEVRKGERAIVLTPAADVTVAVEAKQKPEKESFLLEISWQHSQECNDGEAFCITAGSAGQVDTDARNGAEPAQAGTPAAAVPLSGAAYPGQDMENRRTEEKKQPEETKPADIKNRKNV
jgi:amphi-Trp domain-containing protein